MAAARAGWPSSAMETEGLSASRMRASTAVVVYRKRFRLRLTWLALGRRVVKASRTGLTARPGQLKPNAILGSDGGEEWGRQRRGGQAGQPGVAAWERGQARPWPGQRVSAPKDESCGVRMDREGLQRHRKIASRTGPKARGGAPARGTARGTGGGVVQHQSSWTYGAVSSKRSEAELNRPFIKCYTFEVVKEREEEAGEGRGAGRRPGDTVDRGGARTYRWPPLAVGSRRDDGQRRRCRCTWERQWQARLSGRWAQPASARAGGRERGTRGDQTPWSNTGKSCDKGFRILVDHLGKEV